MRLAACLLLLAACAPPAWGEQPVVGRLFGPADGHSDPAGFRLPPRLRIDGAVVRSSTGGTVWVNGVPLPESEGRARPVRIAGREPEVRLHPAPGALPDSVRVGETVDSASRSRTDIVPPGAITVRRSP